MRNPHERIIDMLEAIANIVKYSAAGKDAFDSNELIQTYIQHNLLILCEAAYRMPEDFRKTHSKVKWDEIIRMRHILVHDYFKIDKDIVWKTVQKDLPKLKRLLKKL